MATPKVLVLWGLCVSGVFSSPSSVPAVIWTNNLLHKFPSTLAGHTTSGDIFANYIHKSLTDNKQNLVVFLQDKLNLEDLSQHADGNTFKNLKSALGSQVSTHLSGVASPTDALSKLKQEFAGRVHEVTPSTKVVDLPMSDEGHDMLVVNLPATTKGQIGNTLKTSDSIIGSVMSKLQDLGKKYTAVYTARESTQAPDESLYMGRHLLAEPVVSTDDNITFTFFNVSKCIFFYATKMTLKLSEDEQYTLPHAINQSYPYGSCSDGTTNGTTWLNITFDEHNLPEGVKYFKLAMEFEIEPRVWRSSNNILTYVVDNGTVVENGTEVKNETVIVLAADFLFAPIDHSYHCGINSILINNDNSTNSSATVVFWGLQVQVGEIKYDKFGRSNDCIGFFTIPIWGGLIVGLLLISILSFGVIMLLMMNSIDRFDDPKGKTITVNITD